MVKQKRAGEDAIGTDIDLMTIKEVAEALKVSVQSVRRLQYGRHVRFFKIGGSVRFAKADITAYLERQTVEPMH
jgi:excisionase family DNA binding protein